MATSLGKPDETGSSASDARAVIESRLDDIDRLVVAAEWEKIDAVLSRLTKLLMQVPLSQRREAMLAARSRVEQVREQVLLHSQEVSGRLASLKTGRKATESYRATGAMTGHTAP